MENVGVLLIFVPETLHSVAAPAYVLLLLKF